MTGSRHPGAHRAHGIACHSGNLLIGTALVDQQPERCPFPKWQGSQSASEGAYVFPVDIEARLDDRERAILARMRRLRDLEATDKVP